MSGIMNMFVATKTTIATAVDAFFNSVSLLLNTSSTNGAQNNTFLDSSTNNFSITRNGNTTQGTFTPFSQTGWSNYQSAIASTYINFTTSPGTLFQFTGDFTIETWIFPTLLGTGESLWVTNDGGSSYLAFNITTTTYDIFLNSTGVTASITSGVVLNQWNHCAMVRSGSTVTLYTNGVSKGTTTNSSTLGYANPSLNRNGGGGSSASWYMSNLRIVKGTAVYTGSTYTVPTTPLTAISGTSLLTCQSNRFVDNSSNALVATVTGTPSVQAFSPFLPTAEYDAAVVGGSGYFDGTSDYLTCASSANLAVGTGDFTYEFWLYPHAANSDNCIFDTRAANNNTSGFAFLIRSSANLEIYTNTANLVCSGAIKQSMWQHVALVRSGSTVTAYVNGVSAGSATFSNNLTDQTLSIASYVGAGSSISAYISGFRVVKGTAVYTATFTPPTSPATAITNTQLLLSGTNSGIFDSAAKNVLETVGNAQVSTTQAKWGTTSMYFDGTGDALKAPYTPNMDFGTGDFTIECWVYVTNTSPGYSQTVLARHGGTGGTIWIVQILDGGTSRINLAGSVNCAGTTVAANTWTHLAFTRSGTSLRAFNNGVLITTVTDSTSLSGTQVLTVGAQSDIAAPFIGYIDDVRITKGYARYTATFTAPTAAFPLQ